MENQVLRKRWRYLLPLALIIVLVPACAAQPTEEPETVVITDYNLEAAIRAALDKTPDEPISAEELAGLTEQRPITLTSPTYPASSTART